MNWFVLRQYRKQFIVFGAILAVFAAFTILTGSQFWHDYQHALSTCRKTPAVPSCGDLHASLPQSFGATLRTMYVTGLGVPLLLGLFLGAPLISKEYEDGTNKLAWTQSVSRRKWLTAKLAWALAFAALYGLAVSLLISWWARTVNALDHSRFNTGQFDAQGIMPFAYSIFFTAAGFALSAWFRKTLVALAVTFGLFVALQASVGQWVRPHYMTPVTATAKLGPSVILHVPTDAWVIRDAIADQKGKEFDGFGSALPEQCQAAVQQEAHAGNTVRRAPNGEDPIDTCLNQAGYHRTVRYQPGDRYWDFQRIEAGIYLGLSALAVSVTYWFVLKRDA